MRPLVFIALLTLSCSPKGPPEMPARSTETVAAPVVSPTPEVDEQVDLFLASPALASHTDKPLVEARSEKMRAAKSVNNALKEHLPGADRDTLAHVQYQRARLFLAVACQMLEVPARAGMDAKAHRAKMVEAAHLFFPGVNTYLQKAVDADGLRSSEAAQVLLIISFAEGPDETCARTLPQWRPRN